MFRLPVCYRWLSLFVLMPIARLHAQDTEPARIDRIGGHFHYGIIFAHSPEVENTADSYPRGLQLEWNWQRISEQVWQNCQCYPQMGFLLSFYDYNNPILGHSLQLAYFLEPTFRLGKAWQLNLRGAAGLAFLSNPHDPVRNPNNQSYSLPLSAYLSVGVGTQLAVSTHWSLLFASNYQHISNGGIQDPNKGINWITASAGVLYALTPLSPPARPRQPFEPSHSWKKEILLFASNKGVAVGEKQRFMIAGLALQLHRQVSRLSAMGAGIETYWDGSLRERLRRDALAYTPWRAGVYAGHCFLLGKFSFAQYLGYYLLNQTDYFHWWYHRWSITYQIGDQWQLGVSLKAHRHIANFLDVRLLYQLPF